MLKHLFAFCVFLLLVSCGGSDNESQSKSNKVKSEWWKDTDKYAICYAKITAAHKANGLHYRNRAKSIQIKEELCKIAATSKNGEGSYWLK